MDSNFTNNEVMPYVKPRKKRGGNFRIFILILIVVAIAALVFVIYKSGERLFSSFGKKTTQSDATTAGTFSTISSGDISVPSGVRFIKREDMSAMSLGRLYDNETDTDAFPSSYKFSSVKENEISVIVISSHGFESYLSSSCEYIDGDYPGGERTLGVDICARNIAARLTLSGVGALYVDVGNTSAYKSYENADKIISKCLKNYPGVKYIIDVHRGIFFDGTGNFISPSFSLDGKPCAQMRFEVGAGGDNFATSLAASDTVFSALQKKNAYSIMPTRIRNGKLCSAGDIPVLTLEIGSAVSSSEEALLASTLFSEIFASLIPRV
ncbi:MAG: stage II sporulation protein P [Eubacteriales bacterium]